MAHPKRPRRLTQGFDLAALQAPTALAPVTPPTAEQLDAAQVAAANTLHRLAALGTPATTRRALASTLRCWAAWHRAAFGTELPLLDPVPAPVPVDTVLMFIAHHAPDVTADATSRHIRTGMPAWVRANLDAQSAAHDRPVTGHRLAHARASSRAAVAADVPSLATVRQRVSLLRSLHVMLGLPAPHDASTAIRAAMSDFGRAARLHVREILSHPKKALCQADVQRVIAACGTDEVGLRDRALMLVTFGAGGRRRHEVVGMQIQDLPTKTYLMSRGLPPQDGYEWCIYALKGRQILNASDPLLRVPVIGDAAIALRAWLAVLDAHGFKDGPVWRRLHVRVRTPDPDTLDGPCRVLTWGDGLRPAAVNAILKRRAAAVCGADNQPLNPADLGAHSLRSGYISTQLAAGVDPLAIAQLTGHRSLQTLMRYDQRSVEHNPALAALVAGELSPPAPASPADEDT